jgi:cell division protease FtsH
MSDDLGPISFGKKEQEIFLGREIAQHRDYSEDTARSIDLEVNRIVRDSESKAENILKDNVDKLHALAEALLVHELLDGEQIDAVMRGERIDGPAFGVKNAAAKASKTKETEAKTGKKTEKKTTKPARTTRKAKEDTEKKTESKKETGKKDNDKPENTGTDDK